MGKCMEENSGTSRFSCCKEENLFEIDQFVCEKERSMSSSATHNLTCILWVRIHRCNICAKTLKNAVSSIHGVRSVRVDIENKLVYVTGKVRPQKLIQMITKYWKETELISSTIESEEDHDNDHRAVGTAEVKDKRDEEHFVRHDKGDYVHSDHDHKPEPCVKSHGVNGNMKSKGQYGSMNYRCAAPGQSFHPQPALLYPRGGGYYQRMQQVPGHVGGYYGGMQPPLQYGGGNYRQMQPPWRYGGGNYVRMQQLQQYVGSSGFRMFLPGQHWW